MQFPPPNTSVHILTIALAANGTSSYRDASAISRLSYMLWSATCTIITDCVAKLTDTPVNTSIHQVHTKHDLIRRIQETVRNLHDSSCCLLFTLSSHGFSTSLPSRRYLEMNGRSEYVQIGRERVMDYELFHALYGQMSLDVFSLCLIDTCHSGTMLDLEYMSSDGIQFVRSKTPLKPRPRSVCISACNDEEMAGEDISTFGGWGGKLTCVFLDYICTLKSKTCFSIPLFYAHARQRFISQSKQASHPIISCNEELVELYQTRIRNNTAFER